jgi:hypothetical protein
MTHPDQRYTIQQLHHQDIQAEIAVHHVAREVSRQRTAVRRAWLARWLGRVRLGRLRGMVAIH